MRRLPDLAEFYDRTVPTVYGVLRQRLGPQRAEAATENIYLTLWHSADLDAAALLDLVHQHLTEPAEQLRIRGD